MGVLLEHPDFMFLAEQYAGARLALERWWARRDVQYLQQAAYEESPAPRSWLEGCLHAHNAHDSHAPYFHCLQASRRPSGTLAKIVMLYSC
jgi:hypothetical protein